jgi:hypothetical protein
MDPHCSIPGRDRSVDASYLNPLRDIRDRSFGIGNLDDHDRCRKPSRPLRLLRRWWSRTAALLKNPTGIAVDNEGDIFVADAGNHRVRKIVPTGVITTFAGTGEAGYTGDGGAAASARISPTGVAVDGKGDVYISDAEHSVVREVNTRGVITTVAGTGFFGFSGDNGKATEAKLWSPGALAVDSAENLYIADVHNNRVRKVTAAGTITTVAGTGLSGSSGDGGPATSATLTPFALAFDSHDNLYVADGYANKVRVVTPGGTITTFAGTGVSQASTGDGGPATSASLPYAAGVAVGLNGDVFIATLCRVRQVEPGGTITTIAGTEQCGLSGDGCAATSAQFWGANNGVAIPVATDGAGDVLLDDYSANNIREIVASEPPASCNAAATKPPAVTPPAAKPMVKPPVVKITSGPPKETADQTAEFKFAGVAGGSYECLIDGGSWKPCKSGDSFSPLQPGDHRFEVRETLGGLTGPAASYSWTIDLPPACILKVARARVFAFAHQDKARLVIHYKAYKPATVSVSYSVAGAKGGLALGTAAARFKTAGVFRLGEKLDQAGVAKLQAATSMKVHFSIPQAPSSCTRYYTKRLTIPKRVFGQTVWFQSDSRFGPGS